MVESRSLNGPLETECNGFSSSTCLCCQRFCLRVVLGQGLHSALSAGHLSAVETSLLRAVVEPEDLPAQDAVSLARAHAVVLHALQSLHKFPKKKVYTVNYI